MKPRDLICAYERAGSAIGSSRLPSKISPNPQQSPNVVASVRNDHKLRESPLNTGGLSFPGKVIDSPAGLRPLVLAIRRVGVLVLQPRKGQDGAISLPEKVPRQRRTVFVGTIAASVGTTAAAVVAAAAASVGTTTKASSRTTMPVATDVQAR